MPARTEIPSRAWIHAHHALRRRLCTDGLRTRLLRIVRPSLSHPACSHTNILFFSRFTSVADVRPQMWGYKRVREIARRMPHYRGEPPMLHPVFAPDGPAAVVVHADGPIPFDAPPIVYSEEDERALEEFARAQGE